MRAAPPQRAANPDDVLVESHEVTPEIWALYEERNDGFRREQLEARFARGLRFFFMVGPDARKIIATTWIVSHGERYFDEVGLSVRLSENEIWVRDIYVHPTLRGRGYFARLLDAVLAQYFPDCRSLASDIDPENHASRVAHHSYGFEEQEMLWGLKIPGSRLLRRSTSEPGESSYLAGRSVIVTGPAFEKHQAAHTA